MTTRNAMREASQRPFIVVHGHHANTGMLLQISPVPVAVEPCWIFFADSKHWGVVLYFPAGTDMAPLAEQCFRHQSLDVLSVGGATVDPSRYSNPVRRGWWTSWYGVQSPAGDVVAANAVPLPLPSWFAVLRDRPVVIYTTGGLEGEG